MGEARRQVEQEAIEKIIAFGMEMSALLKKQNKGDDKDYPPNSAAKAGQPFTVVQENPSNKLLKNGFKKFMY